MKRFPFFFILFLFTSCINQKKIDLPKNFVKTDIPERFSQNWYKLNYSNDDFSVKQLNGKLVIERIKPKYSAKLTLKNGDLIGENGGEWGGKLYFKSNIINSNIKEIKNGNIVKIFKFQNKIYFIEGLAHLSISEGALYELDINNNFAYKKLIDFEDAPEAIETYKDKIYIASHENFYIIENHKKSKVFEKQFWTSLYPNSVTVFDDENVFIGMRSGITKLNLKKKTVEFYREK